MDLIKAFISNNLHTEIVVKGTNDAPLFRTSDIGTVLGLTNIHTNTHNFT